MQKIKKSIFITICNTYCIVHCKIQMIFMMNLQKTIAVTDKNNSVRHDSTIKTINTDIALYS